MKLEEALRLKKVKVKEQVGFDLIQGDSGRMVRKYRSIERDATPEDVLGFNEADGVIVTKDGQKIKIYE